MSNDLKGAAMARVPLVTSPCPLRWSAMPSAGRDFCGRCNKRVHNLDGMNDAERAALLTSCSGEICVAYTVSRPLALAGLVGLGVAAALGDPGLAVAQDQAPAPVVTGPTCDPLDKMVVLGGVKAARDAKLVDERDVAQAPPPQIPEIDAAEWLPAPTVDAKGSK